MKGAILGLPIIGGIIVGVARDNLGKLEPLLAELRQTVDYKVTLNRVVGVAYSNINEMHKALDDAINALTYMSTQWHDLDSQYSGVLGHIENAQKADQNKFKFLKPNLNAERQLENITNRCCYIKRRNKGIKSGNCYSTKIGKY